MMADSQASNPSKTLPQYIAALAGKKITDPCDLCIRDFYHA